MTRGPSQPSSLRRRAVAASGLLHALAITFAALTTLPRLPRVSWASSRASAVQASFSFEHEPVSDAPATCAAPAVRTDEPTPDPQLRDPAPPLPEATEPDAPPPFPCAPVKPELRLAPHEWRTVLHEAPTDVPPPNAPANPPTVAPAPAPATTTAALATVQPSPLPGQNPPPEYPFVPWRRGIEGTVVVRLRIDRDGAVTTASVATSSGCRQLDEAAVRQLKTWRFAPAQGVSGPIGCEHEQAVVFRIRP